MPFMELRPEVLQTDLLPETCTHFIFLANNFTFIFWEHCSPVVGLTLQAFRDFRGAVLFGDWDSQFCLSDGDGRELC